MTKINKAIEAAREAHEEIEDLKTEVRNNTDDQEILDLLEEASDSEDEYWMDLSRLTEVYNEVDKISSWYFANY